ncbi:DEAD/DEAH box helicase [Nocardia abscessus]|uniref:DEAD/DEAH box helicase n=1 Tax=Nocardia abscessus TaxID=120957 RepID=UPI00245823BB|nr:DEAD/DEAH box helicase [Nocardia abscessus]
MATLSELMSRLDTEDTVRRGRQFELICRWFLAHDPVYASEVRQVWLWNDWPGRWGGDAGIDLVVLDRQDRLWAVQAKAYAESTTITKRDVDSFLSESARPEFAFRLLIATTDRIGATAKRTIAAQDKPSAVLLRGELEASPVDWPESPSQRVARPVTPKKPRSHQQTAIDEVVERFASGTDRGQLIMACGTGKTLTALFIREALEAERTLVLVPSLALLSQTLREWTANTTIGFEFLPVCSDQTVADRDSVAATTSDLGFPVTTDPAQIAEFLRRPGHRVLIATYQSSPQVSAAFRLGRVPAFDLVIADEAHRCAGRTTSEFSGVLNPEFIEARRRLFMTATPRYFTGELVKDAQQADFETASMDDPTKFGPVFHELGFDEAITGGLLTDYRVVVVGVDDQTYGEWARHGRLVTTDGVKVTDARTLAGQVGLARAMHRYNLRRTISFHSRVNRARQFAVELPAVIDWMPRDQRPDGTLWAQHTSGEMSAGKRRVLLQNLAKLDGCDRGLLTNARCLNEGVDVPALDGVAFIDPRQSEVDIVQAVGRAIRRSDDKSIGTIVIPVFVDTGQDPEAALADSSFQPVWAVIQALRAHDDVLAESLDEIRYQLGRRGGAGHVQLPDKIVVDLPAAVTQDFADAFNVRLVENTTTTWEFWLGLLEQFIEQEGHALVPAAHKINGFALGAWVAGQRHKHAKGRLAPDRRERLDEVPGWIWDALTAQWEEGFTKLATYIEDFGDALIPQSYVTDDGYPLGRWVTIQRRNYLDGSGVPDRESRLRDLPGWSWAPRDDQWEKNFLRMVTFVEEHGHARVTRNDIIDGLNLGTWAQGQRSKYAEGLLSADRVARLQELPQWSWNPDNDQWEKFFALLTAYVETHCHARVPQTYTIDKYKLGSWLNNQRHYLRTGKLAANRAERLQALPGWANTDPWEKWFDLLTVFVADHSHSRVPARFRFKGRELGSWVAKQRDKYASGKLSANQSERLAALAGWSWDLYAEQWDMKFGLLEAFAQKHGHTRVPRSQIVDGHKLGQWVGQQRAQYAKSLLSQNRVRQLETLPAWTWNPAADQWEEGFTHLTAFVQAHGHARVPQSYVDQSGHRLGTWVTTQRGRKTKGTLNDEQRTRLEAMPGWNWDPITDQWKQGFERLTAYVEEHGHARVPVAYIDQHDYRLGQWCKVQRRNQVHGNLSQERQRRLQALPGWSWNLLADQWEEGFTHLIEFAHHHGHARVPDAFSSADGFRLGQWVGVQRRAHSKGNLSPTRQERLRSIPGWTWNPLRDLSHGTPAL